MSLSQTLSAAASAAQSTLAQAQGMAAGGTNCQLATGQKVVAVFGIPQVIFVPAPGGGYRKKHTLLATITKDQLATAPVDQSRVVRTDVTPPQSYILDHVGRDNVLVWELHLARLGEKA